MGATVLTIADADPIAPDTVGGSFFPAPPAPLASPGSRPGRPHLRSMPTGSAAARSARPGVMPLRLTRFARLSVTMATLAVVIALGVGLSGQFATTATSTRPVTVEQGQTLSQIALRERPDLRVRDGVVALQVANGLSTEQVHAGQRLEVPVP